MAKKLPDYYEVLGVSRDATLKEIRRAYHQAAQKLHPDKNEAPGDTEIFLEVQQAFEVLSNAKRRAKYDTTLPPRQAAEPVILHEVYFSVFANMASYGGQVQVQSARVNGQAAPLTWEEANTALRFDVGRDNRRSGGIRATAKPRWRGGGAKEESQGGNLVSGCAQTQLNLVYSHVGRRVIPSRRRQRVSAR